MLGLRRRRNLSVAVQRIVRSLVQAPDLLAIEAFLVDLEIGADKEFRGQHLDGEANGVGGAGKTLVAHRLPPRRPGPRGEELRLGVEVESIHLTCSPSHPMRSR